jgi:AAA+ ATPase superfamily predicted ATPase
VTRPSGLFDREQEWRDLEAFSRARRAGLGLGVVYGRRRQGKSFLLRRWVESVGGVYHQALEEPAPRALARLGATLAASAGLGGEVSFRDWREALGAACDAARGRAVVIDELPFLLAASPELPSAIQELVDARKSTSTSRRAGGGSLVLCGSAVSVMTELLGGARPLRGRASLELVVRPFDFRQARDFWGVRNHDLAFELHAILGGTAGYRDLLGGPPSSMRALPKWLAAGVLSPAHALFREAEYVLTEDPRVIDRGLYHAVLDAAARGERTPTRIAGRIGRPEGALRHPLRLLEEAGLLDRAEDVLKQRGTTYAVADPIVRFAHVIVRPRLAELEERRAERVWAASRATYEAQILGPHFEALARAWTARYASPKTAGGAVGEVGSAVVTDTAARAALEIDVVALASGQRRQQAGAEVRLVGEAKASERARTRADLARLERARAAMGASGRADVTRAKLALFARGGFDADLVREAKKRDDVELVDLERLYEGD